MQKHPEQIKTVIDIAKKHDEVGWLKEEIIKTKYSVKKSIPILKALINAKYYDIALIKTRECYLGDHPVKMAKYLIQSTIGFSNILGESIKLIYEKGKLMSKDEGLQIARHLKERVRLELAYMVKYVQRLLFKM